MRLLLRLNGQKISVEMENSAPQTLVVGTYTYRPARLAQRLRKIVNKMWGDVMQPGTLDSRLYFEARDGASTWRQHIEGGSFNRADGALVTLGVWDEDSTIGIALHEFAHEIHWQHGGFEASDDIVCEALAIMAERESGLIRDFDNDPEPYYTSSNLIAQLSQLRAFTRQPFRKRWAELCDVTSSASIADMINYYLDRSEGLGLARWLQRYSKDIEVRELLLHQLALCSLRYSLEYRRILIRNVVRSHTNTPLERMINVISAVMQLDWRHPDENIGDIIEFCFAPLRGSRRTLVASG